MSEVARTPVFGVRGLSTASTPQAAAGHGQKTPALFAKQAARE
jgi:hypothetical protein